MDSFVGFVVSLVILAALILGALFMARFVQPGSRKNAPRPAASPRRDEKNKGSVSAPVTLAQIIQGQVPEVAAKVSPDSKYAVVIAPYEMRMSQWFIGKW